MRSKKSSLADRVKGSNATAQIGSVRVSLRDIDVASRVLTQTGQPCAQQRVPVQYLSPRPSLEGYELQTHEAEGAPAAARHFLKPKAPRRLARHLTLLAPGAPMPTRTRS